MPSLQHMQNLPKEALEHHAAVKEFLNKLHILNDHEVRHFVQIY